MPDSDADNIEGGTLTPPGYRARVVHHDLRSALAASAAVVVEGPRGCGKTWTSKHFARSEVLFEQDPSARLASSVVPQTVLEGAVPRLLDEWQLAPDVWPHVRAACDAQPGLSGRFILTGSATPPDDLTRHSGAGRISRVRMRPMSLLESGHSTGEVSLGGLLNGAACEAASTGIDVEGIAEISCRGGWPRLLGQDAATAQRALRDYLDEICRVDVSAVDGVRRDPEGVHRLITSLARNVATTVSVNKLAAEAGPADGLHRTTAGSYLSALRRLFVVEDLPHWRTHLRSRATLASTPKRHFVDPSLAAAALRAPPGRLLGDLPAFGFLFESLVVRDLRVYAQANDATVWHYRDSDHLEADAIVEAGDGRWIAVEVKLGSAEGIDDAARSLLRLAAKVDADRVGAPSKLVVITASGYSYDRPDGVAVVPVSAFAP
ncbi:ATP-binding protein [Candidatus Poriferisodalis sp.]|uniref:ATP-binding protein n=1 Tax=Candidatus Poriferisodalis sp. TaxID=3101277 RepID=UPI003B02A857